MLIEKLDAMDVEHLWEPGRSVAWKTGELLEKQGEYRKSNTHCSRVCRRDVSAFGDLHPSSTGTPE